MKEKYIYDRKLQYVGKKMNENRTVSLENGLSEEQIEFIINACSMRHVMHTNINALYNMEHSLHSSLSNWIEELPGKAADLNLIPLKYTINLDNVGTAQYWDEFDGADFAEEDVCVTERARQEYEEKAINNFCTIHDDVENWLRQIDEKYKTSFAPTGSNRMF